MTMFYNLTNKRPGATWRDRLEELKTAHSEYAKLEPMMTEVERILIGKSISEKQAEVHDYIMQGARVEWQYAINQYAQAKKSLQDAKNREVSRWEASRLNAEMETAERLVTKAVQSSTGGRLDPKIMPRLKAMYDDAQNSGDIYKMRAMAEVFTGLPAMVGNDFDDRMYAHRLSQQAQKDARAVRVTLELEKADRETKEAVDMLNQAKSTLLEVDEGMGYTKPNGEVGNWDLFKELNRVRTNQDGEIEDIVPFEDALKQDI